MKSLTEPMLFAGMSGPRDKIPSEMTKHELVVAVHKLNRDERYIFEERLGILCGTTEPTIQQIDMAWGDVLRARNEREFSGEI